MTKKVKQQIVKIFVLLAAVGLVLSSLANVILLK